MPPVREASTKPSAATVLPAPVACSNQKRLAALGSSAASAVGRPSSAARGSRPVQRLLVGLVLDELLGQLLLARDRRGGEHQRLVADAGAVRRAPVAVGAALRLGQQRRQRAGERVDLVGGQHRAVDQRRLVLGEQAVEAEQQRPAAAPLASTGRSWPSASSFRPSRARRAAGMPGASGHGRVLALEQEGLACERFGALEVVGRRKGCDRQGRCIRLSHEGSTNRRRGKPAYTLRTASSSRTAIGETSSGRLPGKHPIFKQTPATADAASATVCPDATSAGHSRRARARRRARRRAQPGGRRGQRRRPPGRRFDLAKAQRELAGAPAPLAALHDQSAQLLGGGRAAFRKRARELEGYPVVVNKWASWCAPCRTEFPIFQSGPSPRASGSPSSASTPATRRDPARERFLRASPLPVPVLRRPRGGRSPSRSRRRPTTRSRLLRRARASAYTHQGGYRTADLAADLAPRRQLGRALAEGIEHLGWRRTCERAARGPADGAERRSSRPAAPARPGGGFDRRAGRADRPASATPSSRATRTARRPRCGRCAPAAGRPTRPAGSCASVPNLFPARRARTRRAPARTPTPTSSRRRPRPARTRSSSTRPTPSPRSPT